MDLNMQVAIYEQKQMLLVPAKSWAISITQASRYHVILTSTECQVRALRMKAEMLKG